MRHLIESLLLEKLATSAQTFSKTVYHGSGSDFDQFDQRKARIANDFYGGGIAYFTDDFTVATTYAKSMSKKTGTPFVYTVKITLNKLFDVDDVFTGKKLIDILPKNTEEFARGASLISFKSDKYAVLADIESGSSTLTGDGVFKGLSKGMNQTAIARDFLISKGYDGLRYNGGVNMNATRHSVYLAYKASNLKILKKEKL